MMVDDYRLISKLKNNRILSAIESAGFQNVKTFCESSGLSQTIVGEYINMKKSPLLKRGVGWSKQATDLAKALNTLPEDLFSEFQRQLRLERNLAQQTFTQAQIEALTGNDPAALLEQEERERCVRDALEVLSPRMKKILELRFGLDGEGERTRREVGKILDLSAARINQIESNAKRILRMRQKDLHLAEARDE